MKKVLVMLFLLFDLYTSNVSTATKLDIDQGLIDYVIKRDKLIEILSVNIEEPANKAYSCWDSVPIHSPMNLSDIKRLSSDYGVRRHPILGIRCKHNGIDLSGKLGTPIYSTAHGVIISTKSNSLGYGNQVIIEHSDGYKTRYAHLNEINVKQGDNVERGQVIGTLGTTGLSTGPHLHYEVIKNDDPIDPLFFSYKIKEERSFDGYQNILIALEETRKLGMYHHRNVTGHF
jgi:murein DD-endopeptidase MepM/ murein hydrolase activator NlpD